MTRLNNQDDPFDAGVTGYVLVGGRSSRFGSDKALHPVRGRPMAVVVASALREHVTGVTLVGDTVAYAGLGFPIIPDAAEGTGPLGGIVAALQHSRSAWCLVAACDMPKLASAPFTAMFLEAASCHADAVVPKTPDGRLQPLLALYSRSAAEPLALALQQGRWKLSEALDTIAWRELPVEKQDPFTNINRVSDLQLLD